MGRILIIDDEKDLLEVLTEKFALHGWTIKAVSNPIDALTIVEEESFDCVLSDVVMPHMDGFELISRVRVSNKNRTAIVILMSGHYSTKEIAEKADFRISGVLEKPFRYEDFLSEYERMLERKNNPPTSSGSGDHGNGDDFDFIDT